MKARIKIKRVYDPVEDSDGIRILVDRLWPRGFKKEYLKYNMWEKEIAPSGALRKWMHADVENRWDQFLIYYKKELDQSGALNAFIKKIEGYDTVTFLTSTKNEKNHLVALKRFIEEATGK